VLTFHVITLFPDVISAYCGASIIGRGVRAEKLLVKTYSPYEFCTDRWRKVDDTPYGGGPGMVLKPEPFFAAFESIERPSDSPVILLSPQGKTLDHAKSVSLSSNTDITLICGHYEGFDERIRTLASEEISIGDYVLTGGELAALVIIDSVGRLVPGVVGKTVSVLTESFADGLLEGPTYTKPPEFRGMEVPEIVRSGDHKAIAKWRREQALKRTLERRPDLLERLELSAEDKKVIAKLRGQPGG
jgi:tRNA (guanine37-N1)-methyltransferase